VSWDLYFFKTERGTEPVREFLQDQLNAVRMEAGSALTELQESGPKLRRPGADYLRDSIYELRFRSERVEYRILYFFDESMIILTNAFIKKTNKVPNTEIERAIRCRTQWQGK
jgi:phage-related protein